MESNEHVPEKVDKADTDIERSQSIENNSMSKWHLMICLLIFLLKIPGAWHQMNIIFLAPPVTFQCVNGTFDKCTTDCPKLLYDRSVFSETIITEWNLVCDRSQWANTSQTIFMLGILVGSILFGSWSDKCGRRQPLVTAVIIQLIAGVSTAFAPWFWLFCTLRFITAMATGGALVVGFVLMMELVGDNWREPISILFHLPHNIGYALMPLIAYYLRNWRSFQFAVSIVSVVMLSYYWLLPESPRWLFTVGRVDEAAVVLEKAAAVNKLPTQQIRDRLDEHTKRRVAAAVSVARGTFVDLVRTPIMRKRTICICFNWFALGLVYFGVALYVGQSDGNIFANVAMSATMTAPGAMMPILIMRIIGRRNTLFLTTMIAGIAMVLVAVFPQWQVILASVSLFTSCMAFPTTYLYSGELFPTVVRNQGIGIASMLARIGPMIAPFIISLKVFAHEIPPIVLGGVSIVSAVMVLTLPETRGLPLPATIEDGEALGRNNRTQ